MKIYADKVLAEEWPDGTYGGARQRPTRRNAPRRPDPDGAKRLAVLAAEVARIDRSRSYGVNTRYQTPAA